MKKVIAQLLVIGLVFIAAVALCESPQKYTSGDYEYILLDDGTVKITDYLGHAESLNVPTSLSGYSVTEIRLDIFHEVKNITIHQNIRDIEIGDSALMRATSYTEKYNVDKNNPYYKTIDGVLYNKNGDILLSYPTFKKGTTYKVPDSVKIIGDYSFTCTFTLEEIDLPIGLKEIGGAAFYHTNLKTTKIPSTVESISWSAFNDCCSDFSLVVANGSYAEDYAIKNNIKHTTIIENTPQQVQTVGNTSNGKSIGTLKIISDANVRSGASTDDEKVGRVYSGERYPLLDISSNNWYKIQLEDGTKGWVSGKLSEIIEIREANEAEDEIAETDDTINVQYYQRAIIVAATNSQATDVYMSDGFTIDKNKLHDYSDTNEIYLDIESEGDWSKNGANSWSVEGMILRISGYGTYMRVQGNVTFANNEFKITNLRKIISSTKNFDDPNKTSIIVESDDEVYMTVPYSFVEKDRSSNANDTANNTATSKSNNDDKKHTEWISHQFSIWDGSHKEFNKLIIKNLNDEKSFKHIETDYIEISDQGVKDYVNNAIKNAGYNQTVDIDDLFIITEFSAKNGFNATIKAKAYGIAKYSNNALILLGIE